MPMAEFHFLLPAHRTLVEATSDAGHGTTTHVRIFRLTHRWLVITDNQPARLGIDINAYSKRPGFG
jgi:hypothetical protein